MCSCSAGTMETVFEEWTVIPHLLPSLLPPTNSGKGTSTGSSRPSSQVISIDTEDGVKIVRSGSVGKTSMLSTHADHAGAGEAGSHRIMGDGDGECSHNYVYMCMCMYMCACPCVFHVCVVPACLPACLPTCLPACLPDSLPACLPACLPA